LTFAFQVSLLPPLRVTDLLLLLLTFSRKCIHICNELILHFSATYLNLASNKQTTKVVSSVLPGPFEQKMPNHL